MYAALKALLSIKRSVFFCGGSLLKLRKYDVLRKGVWNRFACACSGFAAAEVPEPSTALRVRDWTANPAIMSHPYIITRFPGDNPSIRSRCSAARTSHKNRLFLFIRRGRFERALRLGKTRHLPGEQKIERKKKGKIWSYYYFLWKNQSRSYSSRGEMNVRRFS